MLSAQEVRGCVDRTQIRPDVYVRVRIPFPGQVHVRPVATANRGILRDRGIRWHVAKRRVDVRMPRTTQLFACHPPARWQRLRDGRFGITREFANPCVKIVAHWCPLLHIGVSRGPGPAACQFQVKISSAMM